MVAGSLFGDGFIEKGIVSSSRVLASLKNDGVVGLVVVNLPNTKGKARTRGVVTGCGVPRVSAKSVFQTTVGGRATLNLRTGSCVSGNRLIPSRIAGKVIGRELTRSSARGNFLLSNFPEALMRTGTLRTVVGRLSGGVSTIVGVSIGPRILVRHLANEVVYHSYKTACRGAGGPPGVRKAYSHYNKRRFCRHRSSGPRAMRGHVRVGLRRSRPVVTFCDRGKLLRGISNRVNVSGLFARVRGVVR